MSFDIVVFTQEELVYALKKGIKHIALCDGCFEIPDNSEIEYTAIGNIEATTEIPAECAVARRIIYNGFEPKCKDYEKFAFVPWRDEAMSIGGSAGTSFSSSFFSSYTSSYSSSYAGSYRTSYFGSYLYEYEYEFGVFGSYITSYTTSYVSSYSGSYFRLYTGSFAGSYGSSYLSSYKDPYGHIINPFIFVNGYGIDLI